VGAVEMIIYDDADDDDAYVQGGPKSKPLPNYQNII